ATGNLFISDYYNNRIRKVDLATGTIGTIAGGLGDNGLATATTMSYPVGVATDANGNLFLVDRDANRVRKVSVATGVISAVAGNGTSGFAGDGGSATAAALNNPYGVAVDSSGNVFIADAANARVRKVDHSTGEITTIAGNGTAGFGGDNGPATGASLNYPVAIALDATGHLYISDYSNHRIRRVDLSTGIIATVAGNGTGSFSGDGGQATAASLSTPTGITVDLRGNLYFADYLNFRIRQVNLSTGVISTVAGNGIQGNSGDAGPATLASLSYSWDVAVDGSGHLLIADYGNRRIREVDLSTGIITTAAGSGTSGFSGDDGAASAAQISDAFGVAVDSQANLFVADSSNKRIREVKAGWQLKVAMVSLTVTAPSSVTAGTGMNFTVTALDQHNATATGYAGTVHFTSSDGQAVLSADATLTNGIGQFAAFLQTAGNQTVTAADTNIAITGTSSPIGVSAAAAFRFAINGPQVAAAGTAFTFTISAQDRYFNTATGYNGTVHFASSDFAATLPADTTLTSGTGTFSATLKTAGVRVVAVTDTATSTITGISGNITISNAVTHFAVSAPTNTTAGNGLLVVVTALDQFNNTAVGYSGTIQLTSTDPKAYLQSGTTLTNGVGYFAVILKTAGNQTITATDSANTTITGISITMSVTPAAVDHFLVTAPNTTITGNTFSLTFTAQDSFNNTVPNYAGTAQFSSTDTTAALPPNSTLTSGVGTFSATLNAPGAQKIVATDAANYITGSSNAIASRGLIVNSLTPTATGFVATFNKAFDPSVLNLYDAFNTYGASDVNLVSGNVVETITFGGTITGGSFTLTFKGATTGPITYSSIVASLVANIQSALNALPTVGVGNSVVSATSLASANVAFQGALGLAIQPAFVATSSLTGSSPAVSATVATQATPIKGTLLIDPSNTSMTFVKSGTGTAGVLSAGSYSLTFRSASDGFKDTSGSTLGFLDGNNDGVPGDNYLTTLTVVSTPGVILNIPDFARGPDSSRNVRIPNNNGTAVQALSFTGTSGGTFTLALTGFNNGSYSATTGPISYSAVASTLASNIQSALSALSSPISGVATNIGNTITTPVGANVTVTFQSDLGGAVQPNMVVNTAGLSGASPAANVTTTVAGINLGIPISLSNVAGLTDVTFTLTYNPAYLTIPLTGNTFNASPTSTFTVVGTPSGGVANFSYHSSVPVSGATVTLGQIVAQVPNSTASSYKGKELLHLSNTVINGLNPGVVNSIAFVAVTSGTFSLSFKGATTGTLTYTTDQATLQSNIKTALEALPTIGVGNMLVSASATVYTVYFQGTLALTDQPAILLASSNVSGQIAGAAVGVGKGANSDGVHVIAYLGDASGDGSVSSGDGSLISRVSGTLDNNIVAGVFGGLAAYRLADPVIVGDVSGNAAVDSGDVTLINQSTSGSQQTRLPPIPTGLTISPTGPDPTLSLPTNLTAAPGTSVVVPLYLDTARPEGSLGLMEAILALRYDPKVFTVSAQDVHLGTLPLSGSGWKLQTVVNAQTGEIGIDLFSPTPIVSAGGGSLVTLTLHVLADAPAGASGINLVRSVNPTGQRQYVTTASDAAGPYILHPAVTDDGLDAGVDGRVTVPSLVMETVNVPQATIVTAAALSTAAEIAHMPAEVLSTSRARALNLVDQVFGNLEDPGLVSSFSEFGQPDALLDTDSTDQPLPTSAWAKPTQGLYGLERDWMPTNCMGFVGRGARHGVNATKLLSDTEAEIADADFFAMVKFFAHEVTDRS
ncbi:MAG TPA: NHL repeat-containing protein, partial [Gemmataceae bacterium]|nr:NHL repeat-containing protein [Gemmataceae bacterium]